MVQRGISSTGCPHAIPLSMTEVGMNEYPIDPDKVAAYVREAHRMRSEAMREYLLAAWAGIKGAAAATGRLARSLARRRKWNLSLPAPHR